jgi:hypothetical protein
MKIFPILSDEEDMNVQRRQVHHRYRVLLYRYLKSKFGANLAEEKFSEALEIWYLLLHKAFFFVY